MGIQEYNDSVAVTILVLNSLSAASLLFIIIIYITGFKKANNFPMRMVFYLCIACLLQNIYVFIMNPFAVHQQQLGGQASSSLCNFEGVLKTMSDLSSVIWTTLILFSAYYSIVKEKLPDDMKKLEIWFLIVGFGFPTVLGCLPLAFNLYGYYGYYCWFNTTVEEEFWLAMGFYYFPLWIMFGLNIFLTKSTYDKLKQLQLDEQQISVFKRLLWYPLILFVTAIFSTLHKIQQLVTNDETWLWLIILDYVLFSLYGMFNAVAYGFNPNIRNLIRSKLCPSPERSQSRNTQQLNKQILLQQLNN